MGRTLEEEEEEEEESSRREGVEGGEGERGGGRGGACRWSAGRTLQVRTSHDCMVGMDSWSRAHEGPRGWEPLLMGCDAREGEEEP